MTEKTEINVQSALAIARIALRFGQVARVTRHEDGTTRESDTTHTVMLGLLAMEVASWLGLDSSAAAQFALVHDLSETYAGDTDTSRALSAEQRQAKAEREKVAAQRLSTELGEGSKAMRTLRVYEAQRSSEARLVRYLDKVLPKLTHYLNGGATLVNLGITANQMMFEHSRQGALLREQYPELPEVGRLFAAACDLVGRGVEAGVVRVAEDR